MSQKKYAFTLAEIVITMTMVGVLAAMTIPTLHYQRVKREYSGKLKNFYSRMDNAILDMELDKGSFKDMQLPTTGNGFQWYMDNIDPYMGHQYVNTTSKAVYYKDGSKLYLFYTGGCLDVNYDVNGDKGPNSGGYDVFRFLYCFTDAQRQHWFGNKNVFFGTYGSGAVSASTTREAMRAKCADGATRSWCSRLIQNDQWEFKPDYPLRF